MLNQTPSMRDAYAKHGGVLSFAPQVNQWFTTTQDTFGILAFWKSTHNMSEDQATSALILAGSIRPDSISRIDVLVF